MIQTAAQAVTTDDGAGIIKLLLAGGGGSGGVLALWYFLHSKWTKEADAKMEAIKNEGMKKIEDIQKEQNEKSEKCKAHCEQKMEEIKSTQTTQYNSIKSDISAIRESMARMEGQNSGVAIVTKFIEAMNLHNQKKGE